MEYPQIVFCSVEARGRGLFGVTDHEIGHEWFPMLVGSDERRHAWMDEGLTTFLNFYSTLAFYDGTPRNGLQRYAQLVARTMQSPIADQPIVTYADRIRPEGLGFLAYRKPAAGLLLLREYILGPERFDPAFQAYIDRWAYKHPKPADFFRTMEDVAGENLDWFWRGWFYTTATLDQAVANVQVGATEEPTRITIAHHNDLMLPVEMQITFADGSTEQRRIPVEAFYTSDTFDVTVAPDRTVQQVQLDPRAILPDVDRSNNRWSRGDASSAPDNNSSSN
jgi:aminopeptidase N